MAIFDAAISGLLSSQRSLTTISHNISNVNTEGYSRQRVELTSREAQRFGSGYLGRGVQTTAVTRISSEFLVSQLRASTTASSESAAFLEMASRLDILLADADTSLNVSIQNFFSALQDVNDLPSSITARQVFVNEAESLVERFNFLDERLSTLSNEVRNKLSDDVSDANNIAASIAEINNRIVEATGISGGAPPNDLLDQRDQLLLELSEIVSVNTVEQDDASLNVFIGNGQPLVVGNIPSNLAITETYEGHFDITMSDTSFSAVVTDSISGGSLGAAINFQSSMLEPARAALGRIAIGLVETFNDQHRLGISLDGDVDSSFFANPNATVVSLNGAPQNVNASITDISALTVSDYNLTYQGGNLYSLTRLSDDVSVTIDTGGTWPYTTTSVDGFELTIGAAGTAGDQYIVRPSMNGARDIDVLLTDPRKLAMAGPLKAAAITNSAGVSTNIGNAEITNPEISRTDDVPITGLPLANDITLTFNAAVAAAQNDSGLSGAWTNATSNTDGQNFSLTVDGVTILNVTQAGGIPETIDATTIDAAVTAQSAALTTAGISVTGSAVGGDLTFSRVDGVSFDIVLTNTFNTPGGFAGTDYATGTNTINNGSTAVAAHFDYSVPAPGGTLAYDPVTDNAGKSFSIALNANEFFSFTISGFPQDGDAFVIEDNTIADGDNRNGLLLGELQNTGFFIGGSTTYQDAYGQLVADVGSKTRKTEISSEALTVLRDQALEARESLSGVNLDEEAADLLRFQQSYTAAAQMINVADELFQSLMNAVS